MRSNGACAALFFAFLLICLPACTLQTAPPTHADGTLLYEKASAYGTVVVTDEGDGLRALRFGRDGVRQSLVKPGDPEHLGLAYTPVALTGLALCNAPNLFLVIGLGGGTLPAFLRRHYPEAEIDAVDINPEVVFAAKTHLGFREDVRSASTSPTGAASSKPCASPTTRFFWMRSALKRCPRI